MINVIDLFAGSGGLGEGFASFRRGSVFDVRLSVEMDRAACETLRGRKAIHFANANGDKAFVARYRNRLLQGMREPLNECLGAHLQSLVSQRVLKAEMGTTEGDALLYGALENIRVGDNAVVIGGPPCQAYSKVGRSRNKGIKSYVAELDSRNYLYQEYLRVLDYLRPAVFVMENVQGINSATVDGGRIIGRVLDDLRNPGKATRGRASARYRLFSLTQSCELSEEDDPNTLLVKCERFGIPQARHRVIIFGVRSDINKEPGRLKHSRSTTLREAIGHYPPLRAGLTAFNDQSRQLYGDTLTPYLEVMLRQAAGSSYSNLISYYKKNIANLKRRKYQYVPQEDHYATVGLANHYSRRHMVEDLVRYFHAATWSEFHGLSPKGVRDFDLPILRPNHKNWGTQIFQDRFRCQVWDQPSTTVVSHISKDGHYFIHPDPAQCRSLSVREAAALQTFPDSYVFEGPQTAQYRQVGNAVPVMLAKQIAAIVEKLLI